MSKTTKTITWLIVAVIIIGGIWYRVSRKPAEEEVIKIGYIGPLTGFAAYHGEASRNAIDLAIEEINSGGGINGKKLEIVYEDGGGLSKRAVDAAQKLINIDKVRVLIVMFSGEVLGAAPIAEENKVLLFSPVAASIDITDAGDYIFRNTPSDKVAAYQLLDIIVNLGYQKTALITEQTGQPSSLRSILIKELPTKGIQIADDETFAAGETDFKSYLVKIKSSQLDSLFLTSQSPSSTEIILKQVKELGLNFPMIANYVIAQLSDFSDTENVIFIQYTDLSKEDNPKYQLFLRKYVQKYGKEPSVSYTAAGSYDAVKLLAHAIESVGLNSEKIKDYLYQLDNYEGILGDYHFDENGDVVGVNFTLYQIKNGEIVKYFRE